MHYAVLYGRAAEDGLENDAVAFVEYRQNCFVAQLGAFLDDDVGNVFAL
jgi:hypothetical protein